MPLSSTTITPSGRARRDASPDNVSFGSFASGLRCSNRVCFHRNSGAMSTSWHLAFRPKPDLCQFANARDRPFECRPKAIGIHPERGDGMSAIDAKPQQVGSASFRDASEDIMKRLALHSMLLAAALGIGFQIPISYAVFCLKKKIADLIKT